MPIYDYQCTGCGHKAEVMRKISEPNLSVCPACGKETFAKQVSAPSFQLTGSGWYATDFKGGQKPEAKTAETKPAESKPAESKSAESKSAEPKSAEPKSIEASSAPASCGTGCACH